MGQVGARKGGVGAGKGDDMVPGALSNPGQMEKKNNNKSQVAKRTSMRHRHESGEETKGNMKAEEKEKRSQRGPWKEMGNRGRAHGEEWEERETEDEGKAPPIIGATFFIFFFFFFRWHTDRRLIQVSC